MKLPTRQSARPALLVLLLAAGALPAAAAGTGAVNGFVRDAASGEPLAYANVYLDGTDYGTAANDRGYFYIGGIRPGRYELSASFVGFRAARRPVEIQDGQTATVRLELQPDVLEVGEVKVTGDRARFEREVEVSATRLETRQMALMPRLGGEVDLFRTIQTLPGVITTSDFSNRLYIRGGSPDQNLILLDGISVYNPSHLFGMFSPFIPEAVSDVTLLAGGFPAKYGGRLSSVLDVTTREGNSKRYTGHGSASVVAATASVEGPIPKGSFLVAGRRTYLPDVLLAALGVKGVGYYFYDVMGRVNCEPATDSRFTLAGIAAEDVLSFWDPDNRAALDSKLSWGNRGLSARWNRVFTPVVYGEVLAAWSEFRSNFNVDFGQEADAKFHTDLTDLTLKGDLTWYLADRHTAGFGFDAKVVGIAARFDYDTIGFVRRDTLVPLAVYAEEKWDILPERLFVRPGLRLAWDPYKRRFEPEPRLGAKYRLQKNLAFNAAVGRFSQPVTTLNSTEAVFSVYDVWVSVPRRFRQSSALHYIAGAEYWLRDDAVVEIEAYYKDFADLLETRYGDFFTPPDSLLVADGYSSGAELMLRRNEGRLNGWLSYSFMWTERAVGEETFHPHYDRRHSVNVVINFPKLFWGVDLSAKWTLGTGLPYAGSIGYVKRWEYLPHNGTFRGEWEYAEGGRDAFRYPVYHRLDAGLARAWRFRWGEVTAFADVTNLYNARNVLLYYWEEGADGRPVRRSIGMIPLLPTIGARVKF